MKPSFRGYYANPKMACLCNPTKIQNYMGKISGPLLDRIDILIELPSVQYKELSDTREAEPSVMVKIQAGKTRTIQRERFKEDKIFYNAQMNTQLIKNTASSKKKLMDCLKWR